MFDRSAELYDAFYDAAGKDYAAEAATVRRLAPGGATALLDVACGTGRHVEHLSAWFECTGVDLDDALLDVARRRCPAARFERADMTAFDLGRRFDVVTCLFSSIGYVGTVDRLDAAVASMARHVAPGGVLVVEPWFRPEQWALPHTHLLVVDRPDLKAVRMSASGRRADVALLDFHYLVGTDAGVDHRTEHHELTLFTDDQYRAAFERAGLRAVELHEPGPTGRGLWVARDRR
jgi:ubiquinone/menaquinone biosynthesis C-methylase UbiE